MNFVSLLSIQWPARKKLYLKMGKEIIELH